ncbi:unnamed protein product [Allacma fusca]|uniref:C2H2-type domain-containing protein n=1 Tax=Allacma fusca TaxID=39272 RepID=A0A8J2J4S6_9HEXA|nr:unnamed protein product [Allacma fusca]
MIIFEANICQIKSKFDAHFFCVNLSIFPIWLWKGPERQEYVFALDLNSEAHAALCLLNRISVSRVMRAKAKAFRVTSLHCSLKTRVFECLAILAIAGITEVFEAKIYPPRPLLNCHTTTMEVDIKPRVEVSPELCAEVNSYQTEESITFDYPLDQPGDTIALGRVINRQEVTVDICLLCCRKLNPTESHRSPLDQLNELRRVFRISSASFEHLMTSVELPSEVFCSECTKQLFDAVGILSQIECLQNELRKAAKIMQENVLQHQVREGDLISKWMKQARKLLSQCFAPCEIAVNLSETQAQYKKQKVSDPLGHCCTESENPMVEQVNLISGDSSVLATDFSVKKETYLEKNINFSIERSDPLTEALVETEVYINERDIFSDGAEVIWNDPGDSVYVVGNRGNDDHFSHNSEFFQGGMVEEVEVNENCHAHGANQKRECKPRISKTLQTNPKSNRKYWNGKVVSLNCPYCERKICREDYRTETGNYIFKCFPGCCNKTMSTFFNLVCHHEAYCPSKPKFLRPRKVASRAVVQNFLGSHSWIHDTNKKVSAFECGICFMVMSRSNYQDDSGQFVFKCTWDSCAKITNSFPNLCWHHIRHCSNASGVTSRKSQRRSSGMDKHVTTRYVPGSQVGAGRRYDQRGVLTSLECPCCEKTLKYADFIDESTSSYVFKCPPICCNKVFTTFPNLVFHHESRCKPVDAPVVTDGSLETDPIDYREEATEASKEIRTLNPVVQESFQCKYCHEEFKRAECEYVNPDGSVLFKSYLPNCLTTFTSFLVLKNHHELTCPKRSTDEMAYNSCDQTSSGMKHLQMHSSKEHPHPPNCKSMCNVCGKGFVNKKALHIHKMTNHNTDKKFKCSMCYSFFKSKVNRQTHQRRIHYNHKKFKCSICSSFFNRRDGLKEHQRRVHNHVPPTLETTSLNFSNVNRTFDQHGKLVAFCCPYCHKKLSRDDYVCESGGYVFKCFVNCCNKVMGSFFNLVNHHEASCTSKPKTLRSKVRKTRVVSHNHELGNRFKNSQKQGGRDVDHAWSAPLSVNIKPTQTSFHFHEEFSPENSWDQYVVNDEPVYREVDQNSFNSYDCPHCQRNLAVEDYSTETDEYFFKCLSDGCDEVAEDFSHLVSHHQNCCPSKPEVLKINIDDSNGDKKEISEISEETKSSGNDNGSKNLVESNVDLNTSSCSESNNRIHFKSPYVQEKSEKDSVRIVASSISNTVNRIFDLDGLVVEYDCPICRRNFSRENYSNSMDSDVTESLSDQFHESDDNFLKFISQHEALCSSQSTGLCGDDTKSDVVEKLIKVTRAAKRTLSSDCELTRKSLGDSGFIYDNHHELVAFHCRSCPLQLSRSDFKTQRGIFVFKCTTGSCKMITDNFANLAFHHRSHCAGIPLYRQLMTPQMWIPADGQLLNLEFLWARIAE